MSKFIVVSTLTVILLWGAPGLIGAAAAVEGNFQTAGEKSVKKPPAPDSSIERGKVGEKLNKLYSKLNDSLGRTTRLLARANSLIAKFENRGLDMTKARATLTEATVVIEQAKQAINKFKNEAPTATAKTLPEPVRKTAAGATQAIKKAHAKVVEIIRLIRASYDQSVINPTAVNPTPANPAATPTP